MYWGVIERSMEAWPSSNPLCHLYTSIVPHAERSGGFLCLLPESSAALLAAPRFLLYAGVALLYRGMLHLTSG